jgi:hypothetical protein
MEHRHRIDLTEVTAAGGSKVIAAGTLSAAEADGRSSFWAVEHLKNGRIVAAQHYLSDRFHLR